MQDPTDRHERRRTIRRACSAETPPSVTSLWMASWSFTFSVSWRAAQTQRCYVALVDNWPAGLRQAHANGKLAGGTTFGSGADCWRDASKRAERQSSAGGASAPMLTPASALSSWLVSCSFTFSVSWRAVQTQRFYFALLDNWSAGLGQAHADGRLAGGTTVGSGAWCWRDASRSAGQLAG